MDNAPTGFFDQVTYDRFEVAGFLVDAKLALGAGAFAQNCVHVLDGAAAAEIVDNIIDEFEQFGGELAHRDFRFFAEIDELALDAITRGTPLIFLDEGAPIQTEAHVAGVKPV